MVLSWKQKYAIQAKYERLTRCHLKRAVIVAALCFFMMKRRLRKASKTVIPRFLGHVVRNNRTHKKAAIVLQNVAKSARLNRIRKILNNTNRDDDKL
jgi:hypothetical protein